MQEHHVSQLTMPDDLTRAILVCASLTRHGEWCKHTNFVSCSLAKAAACILYTVAKRSLDSCPFNPIVQELATHAPMMIRVPGLTDKGMRSMAYTEHIDLFPTLAEIAAVNYPSSHLTSIPGHQQIASWKLTLTDCMQGVKIPPCPTGPAQLTTPLCTMGNSLVPLLQGTKEEVATASFSQYPRGYVPLDSSSKVIARALAGEMMKSQVSEEYSPSPSACLDHRCTMGYSVVTKLAGTEYRYTEW